MYMCVYVHTYVRVYVCVCVFAWSSEPQVEVFQDSKQTGEKIKVGMGVQIKKYVFILCVCV